MLVTEDAGTAFSVVSPLRRLPGGRSLYKLFSVEPLGRLLSDMFADHVEVTICQAESLSLHISRCFANAPVSATPSKCYGESSGSTFVRVISKV